MAGGAVNTAAAVVGQAGLWRAEDALVSEFSDPPEFQAFTAKSFVLLTNHVLILTSC